MYISCKHLTVYFSPQVKNKPNGGIAFPAFILGICVFTNRDNSKKKYRWLKTDAKQNKMKTEGTGGGVERLSCLCRKGKGIECTCLYLMARRGY